MLILTYLEVFYSKSSSGILGNSLLSTSLPFLFKIGTHV